MSDERLEDRQVERDSQLSAMFDDQLPAAECELLARRLSRDEALRAQWSRFAMIGAALRAERGVALHDRVAWKVQAVIAQETSYGDASTADAPRSLSGTSTSGSAARQRWSRFALPMAGAGIAASVAALSIFWLRGAQDPGEALMASTTSPTSIVLTPDPGEATTLALNTPAAVQPEAINEEPGAYTTPTPSNSTNLAPPARLANYVVAHSEYSGPLSRRMALLGIVGADGESTAAPEVAPAAEQNATEGVDAP